MCSATSKKEWSECAAISLYNITQVMNPELSASLLQQCALLCLVNVSCIEGGDVLDEIAITTALEGVDRVNVNPGIRLKSEKTTYRRRPVYPVNKTFCM